MIILFQIQEQVYSGLLKFNYFNGQEDVSENVHVNSATTAGDLIPELLNRFLPSLESRLDALEGSHHTYIALVQGDSKLTNFTVARLFGSRHCPPTLVANHFDWYCAMSAMSLVLTESQK